MSPSVHIKMSLGATSGLGGGERTLKQGSLIASAVLSACYVTLRANAAHREHTHTGGEAPCWATATISCLWRRFREAGNRGKV